MITSRGNSETQKKFGARLSYVFSGFTHLCVCLCVCPSVSAPSAEPFELWIQYLAWTLPLISLMSLNVKVIGQMSRSSLCHDIWFGPCCSMGSCKPTTLFPKRNTTLMWTFFPGPMGFWPWPSSDPDQGSCKFCEHYTNGIWSKEKLRFFWGRV